MAPAWQSVLVPAHPAEPYPGDIKSVLLSEEQIRDRTCELAAMVGADYDGALGGEDLLPGRLGVQGHSSSPMSFSG